MSKNQRGFSAVESLLVLTIVILIGAVGYMVYKNHHKTSGSTNNSNVSVEATSPSNSPYTGWKIYTALSHISFKYPSNWTVTTSNNAPVSKSVTVNAPSRNIGGTNYQFGLFDFFTVHTPVLHNLLHFDHH
jgi:Tfp pilus assembly protein PilV